MKHATSLLLSAAIVGSLSVASFAPAAYADEPNGWRKGGDRMEQHMNDRDGRGMGRRGGFIRLMCSEDGAARLELMLNHIDNRITLTDEQKALYDTFKTDALAAQTQFADNCVKPERGPETDIVDRIKANQANMKAMVTAMDEVIPSFEAFHDSLTDAQKAEMKPQRGNWDGDRGPRHDRQERGNNG